MAALLLLALVAVACAGTSGNAGDDGGPPLEIFAAASLADAFNDMATAFEAETGSNIDIALNLAGSSTLREQILEGAPADVFASANSENMDRVRHLLVGPPHAFASNSLTIAVPPGNPAGLVGLSSFEDDSLLLGACQPAVPCGALAREAFDASGIDARLDTEEVDVGALLTKIEAGELDGGLVYTSDLRRADVEGISLTATFAETVRYPIGVLADSDNATEAEAFVDFVRSSRGQAILADHGFGSP